MYEFHIMKEESLDSGYVSNLSQNLVKLIEILYGLSRGISLIS